MLVLSRKRGEQIRIPTCDLLVTVLDVQGGRVRLGISAPGHVDIVREEVWTRNLPREERQEPPEGRLVSAQSKR